MNINTIIICIISLLLQSTARCVAFYTKLHHFQLPKSLVCQNSLSRQTNSRRYDNRGQRRCYTNHRAITFELKLSKHTEEDDVIPKSPLITDTTAFDIDTNLQNTKNERTIGILILLTVPLAWGTYAPVVRYMYNNMEPSMPGFIFSAGYYIVAALTLGLLSLLSADDDRDSIVVVDDGGGRVDATNVEEETDHQLDFLAKNVPSDSNDNDDIIPSITTRGGLELGSYLFIGNGLQVVGLQTVPADRAAFLVQLTTIFVPLLSALSAGNLSAIPLPTWFACTLAFTGVIIMGADDKGGEKIVASSSVSSGVDHSSGPHFFDMVDMNQLWNSLQLSQGDILIILAAVAYTMHVVRLGTYAPRTTPLKLASSKATTEAILSVLLVITLTFIGNNDSLPEFVSQTADSVSQYFTTISTAIHQDGGFTSSKYILGAILWTGWVTCAYTIYAQSFGQKRVNPTDSNLLYTTQPLFSSLFAYFLLGETLGTYGYVGASLIGVALWLVSSSESDEEI